MLPVNPIIANAIQNYRYKWSVMMAVFFIEKGEKKIRFEIAEMPNNRLALQSEIVDDLNVQHQRFIREQKDKNVNLTGAGWLASPHGRDFDEQESGEIFERLRAF